MTEDKRVDRGGWVQIRSLGAHHAVVAEMVEGLEAAHDHGDREAVRWHADAVLEYLLQSRPAGGEDSQAGRLLRRLVERGS